MITPTKKGHSFEKTDIINKTEYKFYLKYNRALFVHRDGKGVNMTFNKIHLNKKKINYILYSLTFDMRFKL